MSGRLPRGLALAAGAVLLASCAEMVGHSGVERVEQRVVGAEPAIGRVVIAAKGCTACHRIPGLPGPYGNVGPALDGLAARVYLPAGLANRPDNLVAWLMSPPSIDPATAMPDLGLGPEEAKHVAAYLYALE